MHSDIYLIPLHGQHTFKVTKIHDYTSFGGNKKKKVVLELELLGNKI